MPRGSNDPGSIEVEGLVRDYRRPNRGPGLLGALKQVIRPSYEVVEGLRGIDLSVRPGETVGYVGLNGSGKSTTIKLLSGVMRPTSGLVRVNGLDPVAQRAKNASYISVVWGQRIQLWWDLPLRESFSVLRYVYGVEKSLHEANLKHLVEALGLGALLSSPVRQLSLGQRTLATICAALLHDPSIVFLDEPTIGLDYEVKNRVREVLQETCDRKGTTLLLTSHDLVDVEQLCERIVILHSGRILHDGPLDEAVKRFAPWRTLRLTLAGPVDLERLRLPADVSVEEATGAQLAVRFDERTHSSATLVPDLLRQLEVNDFSFAPQSVEDVLREIMNGPARS
jgi:ABC-2 type transport system ATP-binding protein